MEMLIRCAKSFPSGKRERKCSRECGKVSGIIESSHPFVGVRAMIMKSENYEIGEKVNLI